MSDQLLFSRLPRNLAIWRNRQVKKRIMNECVALIRGLVGSRWITIKVSAKLRFGCQWGRQNYTHGKNGACAKRSRGISSSVCIWALFDIILTMIDATNDAHVGLWEACTNVSPWKKTIAALYIFCPRQWEYNQIRCAPLSTW